MANNLSAPKVLKQTRSLCANTVYHPVPSPRGAFGRLAPPQTKLQAPPNWNMKSYKSVEISSMFRASSPPAQTSSPPTETQSPLIKNFLATVLAGTGVPCPHLKSVAPILCLARRLLRSSNIVFLKCCPLLCNFWPRFCEILATSLSATLTHTAMKSFGWKYYEALGLLLWPFYAINKQWELDAEPSPESRQQRGFMFVRGGAWHSKLTKIPLTQSASYFNLGGLGALFGGAKPTKAPPDGIG